MIDIVQFYRSICIPTLEFIEIPDKAGAILVMGTGLAESGFTYLEQKGGPALGFFQMEPATHDDIWNNYLKYHPKLAEKLEGGSICPFLAGAHQLLVNLSYATAMCRIHYYRPKPALPSANDIEGLARYWKRFYNTDKGAGTIEHFMQNEQVLRKLLTIAP